ncbi:MAG: hypothetical protein KAR21_26650, partial [Spirochaetales bacterium]|nr:hypothetical protein [Spirochaetales bacterium]
VYQQIFFDQFLFHLSNQGPGSDVNLTIYTLKKNLTNIVDWTDMVSDATIDYDSAITRQVTIAGGADQSIDISAVANRMFLYDARAIAIYADSFITFDIANWSIDTHFWGNY